jgi:hypothetical protein
MNASSFVMNYGILWLYYSRSPVNPDLESLIRANYIKLGITMENNVLKTPQHLEDILISRIWKRSSFIKIAIKH